MFLVDTNIISELRKADRCEPKVARWYERVADEDLFTSVLVLGEIQRGVESLRRRDEARTAMLEAWLSAISRGFHERIIPVDLTVARKWGELNAHRTYPVFDGLLAATALAHELILVTRNVADIHGTAARYVNPFEDRRVRVAK